MTKLTCVTCGAKYSENALTWRCNCGGLLDIAFQPVFPIDEIRQRKPGMWRYREAIPIAAGIEPVSFQEGFTPLVEGADAALKAANVDLVEWRQVGSGIVSFIVEGEVAAVRSAIEAGRSAAQAAGEVVSEMVIPRPVDELRTTFNK